ncbi:MAG: Gfo/Idh/MocA family protein [Faecousia sp.]
MKIGICGTGTIASWISDILNQLEQDSIVLYACATAPGFDCREFAAKYGWKKVHASYADLMQDPEVDLVYIAVPNTFHYDLCKQALNAGKAVLVEKPFAMNDRQAAELIALAEEKGLFLCEALWPSFLPVSKAIDDEITAGTIGQITGGNIVMLDNVLFLERVKSLELGGGSLLDGGPYTLGFLTEHFGIDIASVSADVRKFETGVDAEDRITVEYANGVTVNIRQTMDCPRQLHEEYAEIIGTNGKIWVDCVSNPRQCRVLDREGNLVKELPIAPQVHFRGMPPVSGYEHEFLAYEKALREGRQECPEVTHARMLTIAKIMSEVRRQGGICFPFES